MTGLRTLILGGTGVISSACVLEALSAGHQVTVLNRGTTAHRPLPDGVRTITADVRDSGSLDAALGAETFDVVADFLSFEPDHVGAHIDRWTDRTGHYLFISSASVYQTPPARLPVVESTPLRNPVWRYARNKIACEERLVGAYRRTGFPMTIVRPSHTYDRTSLPFHGSWTWIERMRRGKPVIVHGDGTSLWTLTHHVDFARAFVGLFGDVRNHGDVFHITSDEVLTWDQIAHALAAAAGAEAEIVHVVPMPSSPAASTPTGVTACWATRRTRCSSTTPRSRQRCRDGTPRSRFGGARHRSSSGTMPTPHAGSSTTSSTPRWTGSSRATDLVTGKPGLTYPSYNRMVV